ncbi:hypothetical protein L6164_036508 [Bauhinia variegata]|uniref:Uncharacterized protein n=1 Tax=Bauhinia variegata TaxID=167791 RepID=A0ACB9KH56_BAUVA|nr:hypothetical protein L6164_036508 [Bauhinia variegata]
MGKCSCLSGFEPRNPNDWYKNRDASGGCVKKNGKSIICGSRDGFVKVEGVKIPHTSGAIEKRGLSLEECEKECLRNCSCMAYVAADVTKGKRTKMVIPVVSASATALLSFCLYCFWKQRRKERIAQRLDQDSLAEEEHDETRISPYLPFFYFKTVMVVTNNFALENKLWQGGFGSVYKVWDLHREKRTLDIVDSALGQSFPASLVLWCFQIGLLSVMDRPSMFGSCFMVGNETTLPSPTKPGFLFNGNQHLPETSNIAGGSSVNEMTATTFNGR